MSFEREPVARCNISRHIFSAPSSSGRLFFPLSSSTAVIDTCIRRASESSQPSSCVPAPLGRSRGSRPRTLACRGPPTARLGSGAGRRLSRASGEDGGPLGGDNGRRGRGRGPRPPSLSWPRSRLDVNAPAESQSLF